MSQLAMPQLPQEDKQLKAIMTALKKHSDALPPELQTMVNEAAIKEGQMQTKHLHALVAAHGRARKELQQAQLARFNLHTAWKGFLSQAVTLWEGYSRQFSEQEQQLNERVDAAQLALEQAKESLATTKSQAGMDAKDETMQVSEDENDKDVAGRTSARIKEGLSNLHTSLAALKTSADQLVEEEQKAIKRPRIEPQQADSTDSALGKDTWLWFWLGRVNTDDIGIALRPQTHPWDVHPLIPKWLHTVVHEHDFVSEWAAIDEARSLASSIHACTSTPKTPPISQCRPCRGNSHKVCFASEIQLVLGQHDGCPFFEFSIPMCSLNAQDKPWKLNFDQKETPSEQRTSAVPSLGCRPVDALARLSVIDKCNKTVTPSQSNFDQIGSASNFDHVDALDGSCGMSAVLPWSDFECAPSHFHKLPCPVFVPERSLRTDCWPSDDIGSIPPFDASVNHYVLTGAANNVDTLQASGSKGNFVPLQVHPIFDAHEASAQVSNQVTDANPVTSLKAVSTVENAHTCQTDVTISVQDHVHQRLQNCLKGSKTHDSAPSYSLSKFRSDLASIKNQIQVLSRIVTSCRQSPVRKALPCTYRNTKGLVGPPAHLHGIVSTQPVIKLPSVTASNVPIQSVRLEHESPIAHLRDQMPPGESDDDTEDDPDDQEPVTPRFVDELANRVRSAELSPNDQDFDLAVRTWFIDHAVIHRWTAPRLLQLVGPPQGWEAQLTSIWVDQINPDDWFDVAIVAPDPPRPREHSCVVFDLIGVQSVTFPRIAALVTVIPGHSSMFSMFSVACSLPEVASGYDIIQSADAGANCRNRQCIITNRMNQIPNNMRPMQQVGHGDSFQIAVHPLPSPSPDEGATGEEGGKEKTTSSAEPASSSTDRPPASFDPEEDVGIVDRFLFATVLHIFQYNGPEVVVELVNQQIIQPTQAIADSLGVPFDALEALHVMSVHPNGLPDYHSAAVVQRVGDVPIRSTDRLLLLDIEYHHHPNPDGSSLSPTVIREVMRAPFIVTRHQLLMSAGVYHYCQMLMSTQASCQLRLNGLDWGPQDVAPRPVQHGSYAHILIPPPPGHDVPAETAARVVEEIEERPDAFAQEIRELLHSDDEVSLAQLSIYIDDPTSANGVKAMQQAEPPPSADHQYQPSVIAQCQGYPSPRPLHGDGNRRHLQTKAKKTYDRPPGIHNTRLEHESPLDQLPGAMHAPADDPAPDDQDTPDRPELPAFANSLANRMLERGVNPNEEEFELRLRTWYIAHDTVRRWTAPRIFNLVGPPAGWEPQIRQLWIDQLDPTLWFAVTVIEPDPPRPVQHGPVVYDIIIEQAFEIPRSACLVTVLPEQPHHFPMFSVACSLPGNVGGYDIIQAADAGHVLPIPAMYHHI